MVEEKQTIEVEIDETLVKEYESMENEEQGIQTTFNEDSLEVMNDEDVIIENVDEEEIEGIGATGFSMRTTKPSGNKNFMTTGTGGWSTCIKGSPCDSKATVLSNCVGNASARFNEIINEARGTSICTYKTLNCNAENFPERAIAAGLKTGATPRRGAIICWQKGTLSSSDGAGHVEVVERVDSNSQIYTSASNYGGTTFYNATRKNSNGNWGLSSPYKFRCFIYLPDDVQKWVDGGSTPAPTPTPTPTPSKTIDELAKEVIAGKWGIFILGVIFSPKVYLVTTARYGKGTEIDNKNVKVALGEENTEERFLIYFQWYNVIHELGHGVLRNNSDIKISPAEEEQLVNDFAVAYWLRYGEEDKIEELRDIVEYASTHIESDASDDISYLEFAEKNWYKPSFKTFNNYGWFQFNSVKESLKNGKSLEEVLKEMGIEDFELNDAKVLEYSEINEKVSTQIINDAVDNFHAWGIKFPRVIHFYNNDPNANYSRNAKNVFGIYDIMAKLK